MGTGVGIHAELGIGRWLHHERAEHPLCVRRLQSCSHIPTGLMICNAVETCIDVASGHNTTMLNAVIS